MDYLILFGVGLSTGLSGAMIPGPLFLYTVSEAFRQGQLAGIKVTAGHLLLEAAFVALIVVGLREWLTSQGVRWLIAWVGGASLVGMGLLVLAKARHLSLAREAHVHFRGGTVLGGAFFSITSPGFVLWWATIGAAVLFQGMLKGTLGMAMICAGHAAADLIWHWFVALSVERGKVYCSDKTYRFVISAMALVLIALGLGLPVKYRLGI